MVLLESLLDLHFFYRIVFTSSLCSPPNTKPHFGFALHCNLTTTSIFIPIWSHLSQRNECIFFYILFSTMFYEQLFGLTFVSVAIRILISMYVCHIIFVLLTWFDHIHICLSIYFYRLLLWNVSRGFVQKYTRKKKLNKKELAMKCDEAQKPFPPSMQSTNCRQIE